MAHTDKKQIVVGRLGDGLMFTVKDPSGEILFECIEPFRSWGISRCANWIKRYNEKENEVEDDTESEN